MTLATAQLDTVWIPGEETIWQFVLPTTGRDDFEGMVFPNGTSAGNRSEHYSIGTDRILQKMLEGLKFRVHVYVVRSDSVSFIKRAPLIVIFCPNEFDDKIRSKIDPRPDIEALITVVRDNPRPSLALANGYSTFNTWAIHKYVADQLKKAGLHQNDRINLNDAANVWKGLTGNVKSTVYDWMRRGPVFMPVEPVKRRDPTGCRLDVADLVVIGLLHGLVSHGLVYRDFEGPKPAQFMRAKSR